MNTDGLKSSAISGILVFSLGTLSGALETAGYGQSSIETAILLQVAGLGIAIPSIQLLHHKEVAEE